MCNQCGFYPLMGCMDSKHNTCLMLQSEIRFSLVVMTWRLEQKCVLWRNLSSSSEKKGRKISTYLKCILFSFTRNKSRQRNKMKGKGSGKTVYKEMQPLASWKKYVQFKIISIQNMPHTIKMIIIFIHIP